MRVSSDVGLRWAGAKSVGASTEGLNRFWMHGLLFDNDPGCLLLRNADTELTTAEIETLLNAAILSGGVMVVSDALAALPPARVRMLRRLASTPTTRAVPLDLYKGSRASVWFAAGEEILLGVFNWSDKTGTFRVNPRKIAEGLPVTKMRDFHRRSAEGLPEGVVDVALRAHHSRLFVLE
jgi:alpha-galactosidase